MKKVLILLATLAFAAACSSGHGGGGGGGGSNNVGGAVDSPCAPAQHAEGCSGNQKVSCDGTTNKWKLLGECATGSQYCSEVDDGSGKGTKKAECKAYQTGGGADATGGGDGGGTTSKTPAEQVTCAQQKCVNEYNACIGNALCAQLMNCIKACANDACAELCGENAKLDDTAGGLALALGICAGKVGCAPPPDTTVCGNGACESGESKATCPQDCSSTTTPVCGNGKCESPSETPSTCAKDCGSTTPVCGNGVCESGENVETCYKDCGSTTPVCGNGKCESGETKTSCAKDCGGASSCGDGKCVPTEIGSGICTADCSNTAIFNEIPSACQSKCASAISACKADVNCLALANCLYTCEKTPDAGEACDSACLESNPTGKSKMESVSYCIIEMCGSTPKCGNGTCESGETPSTCPSDCKSGPVCGNGKCESGETKTSCAKDCGTSPECMTDNDCAAKPGTKCLDGVCAPAGGCGNGTCDPGEETSCPSDCGDPTGSCQGKCGKFEAGASCQCDEQCSQYGDCCPDYKTLCAP